MESVAVESKEKEVLCEGDLIQWAQQFDGEPVTETFTGEELDAASDTLQFTEMVDDQLHLALVDVPGKVSADVLIAYKTMVYRAVRRGAVARQEATFYKVGFCAVALLLGLVVGCEIFGYFHN